MSVMVEGQFIAPNKINAGMPLLQVEKEASISPYEFMPSWFFSGPGFCTKPVTWSAAWRCLFAITCQPED